MLLHLFSNRGKIKKILEKNDNRLTAIRKE